MLFNRNAPGSEELYRITGSFAAGSDFGSIAQELADAARTVGSVVGDGVVKMAEKAYESGRTGGLVAAVQLPVALLAILRQTRSSLVTHGDRGSKVVVDADEKIPFEWMIDRDERAQLDRYYRALDALWAFIEESTDDNLKAAAAHRLLDQSIVKSLEEFEEVYPIDGSRYVFHRFLCLVVESQGRLRRLIGPEAWDQAVSGEAPEMRRACVRFVVLSAVARAVRRWSLAVLPLSVARRFSPSYQGNNESSAATREEMESYAVGLDGQIDEARLEVLAEMNAGDNPYDGYDPLPFNDPSKKYFTVQ